MTEIRRRDQTGAHQLLRTKLMPPRLPAWLLPRPSLFARLNAGLARKLTLVSAPAGYGKSTLVAHWLTTRREPSAWLALDPTDDDPVRFWNYVLAACQGFAPRLGKSALASLRSAQQFSFEAPITSFINELAALPEMSILVLEDYHVIRSPEIHTSVTFLLDHVPDTIHLVLLARAEPTLGLARLRAHNQVSEINAADLQFTREETQAFLQQELGVQVKPETVARLDERAEGWAAGLRLLVLALEGKGDAPAVEQLLLSFSGGHRHVDDYLAGEVLAEQPEPVQEFLLQTSILTHFTPSLCNAVTGRDDSASVLAQLERANLFLVPLGEDGDHAWYRYHALFAEALRHAARKRFGEEGMRGLYARASAWHEAHGLFDQAIETALAAAQYARVAALIEQSIDWPSRRELYTLRRWIEQIPEDLFATNPTLCFEYAVALLFTSDRYAAATAAQLEVPLRTAEQTWRAAGDGARLGQVLALRGMVALWQGDFDRAFALASDSLQLLPEHDAFWRGSDLIITGIQELNAGRVEAAQNVLIEARALSGAALSIQGQLAATSLLADAYLLQGEFDQARQFYAQVQAEAVGTEDMIDDQGAALLGLSTIAYERNDLDAAERDAARALELGGRRSNAYLAIHAALMLVRVWHARGQLVRANAELRTLIAQTSHTSLVEELLAWQARLALAGGDTEAVHHWHAGVAQRRAGVGPEHPGVPAGMQEEQDLIWARLLVAEERFLAALEILERWHADARQHGRTSRELEALITIARAHAAQSNRAQAGEALLRVLSIAQPRGFQRTILDEGEPMRRLMSDYRLQFEEASPRLKAYAYRLLAALSADTLKTVPAAESATPEPAAPFEPLSPQERRVLRLLAAGLSNPEIARELVVSTNTIKTQLQSVYRKLNVNSRTQAREVARELKLL